MLPLHADASSPFVHVCGRVLWACACVCAQQPHRYMNTCMRMCMHVQNAKPEGFNLPLAIFLSLIGVPFVVLRKFYKVGGRGQCFPSTGCTGPAT